MARKPKIPKILKSLLRHRANKATARRLSQADPNQVIQELFPEPITPENAHFTRPDPTILALVQFAETVSGIPLQTGDANAPRSPLENAEFLSWWLFLWLMPTSYAATILAMPPDQARQWVRTFTRRIPAENLAPLGDALQNHMLSFVPVISGGKSAPPARPSQTLRANQARSSRPRREP